MDSAARLCDSGYGLFELAIIEDTTTNSETVMISVKDDFFNSYIFVRPFAVGIGIIFCV